ncbi:uncharacterized protein BDR25DRAFT_313655 [Lindgomyces ingoldianus]|uniref:Uncharacterized protein n=1 Tax=Lindgomyces ingoldianus TaxID=673940 RepID=A0ACB6QXK1_9PLEO|nr:uncharacterized protein BDR25DRAFT_313655 [Lindgomyces ingoldianus]KAF2471753.1 hypothetical protein BDR25DRAFT_313655 [Lindgomyces ingoldianus]
MPSSPPSDIFLSIRTSCDRCRFQKLKCLISEDSSNSMCCQRCARAMVPCVFSRRNKSRRKRAAAMPISEGDGVPTKVTTSSPSQAPCPSPMKKDIPNSEVPVTRTSDGFSHDSRNQAFTQGELALNGALEPWGIAEDPLNYPFQEDTIMNDLWLFTDDISLGSLGKEGLGLPNCGVMPVSSSTSEEKTSPFGSTSFEAHMTPPERGAATKVLLCLASDLHETLEALNNGRWQQRETCRTLDNYPIGNILHLSQEFIELGTALRKVRSEDDASGKLQTNWQGEFIGAFDPPQLGQGSTASPTSSSYVDTSVTLILVSCFVTLTRIYSTVLGHFRDHLNLQPSGQTNTPHTSIDLGPTLCFGELPPTNTCYSRVYTAVSILLDLFKQAEEAFGLPPENRFAGSLQSSGTCATCTPETKSFSDALVNRGLAGALPCLEALTSASGVQEALSVLEKQVADIKGLVREKMGL